ncbi:MAG: hypothetical protein V4467_02005 [Patescibacteria group bacterium]
MSPEIPKIKEEWKPEPAESFGIEFGSAKILEFQQTMNSLGFRHNGSDSSDDEVVVKGQRLNGDGTEIEIRIRRGPKYKSPMELAKEEAEREEKERAQKQGKA